MDCEKDLVFIGGGHSHAIALRMFGIKPLPGVRITLITPNIDTPYSGMLPGHIAGFYNHAECHINLQALTNFGQVQLILDKVIGIDLEKRQVICNHSHPVSFDILSIDIGSTPATITVPGAEKYAIPAKPVERLLATWQHFCSEITSNISNLYQEKISIGIIGGGAGGVELSLAMQAKLQEILERNQSNQTNLEIHLFQRDTELLSNYNSLAQRLFKRLLLQRGINLHLQETVSQVEPHRVICASGLQVDCDKIFWVTQASAPDWLNQTGLATDKNGFILINNYLQSISHSQIFAAGDIATIINYPRPKAGVFAVRQGKPLFNNLQRVLLGKPLTSYQPQQKYLSLIGTGDGRAVAIKGAMTTPPHRLLWRWKDWIDRRFMKQFTF